MKKTISLGLLTTALLGGLMLNTTTHAMGWTPGQTDPNTPTETVDKKENAEVEIKGWIGKQDGTDPEGPEIVDPSDPTKINITIPTTVLYANGVDDQGDSTEDITSPIYTMRNNSSTHDLAVSIDKFEETTSLGIKQELYFQAATEAGVKLQTKAGQHLNKKTFLTKLDINQSKNFNFSGKIDQSHLLAGKDTALRPEFKMNLHFAATKHK
ncbi:hypothetical protein DVW83_03150 [Enterococcus sp. VV15]|uniref:hypothetical protein n=1 Tax=Enterococcus sp. VV15 TaxID=2233541 RepID=UPI0010C1B70F|nr:hypothetical protein [Enterococcus sp. VV15]TKN19774.1 hypothetical protein DVW83_03150 [Enterococcus sp. VV15]